MISRMLLLLLGFALAVPAVASDAETIIRESFEQRRHVNRIGMTVLGGWAVGNIALGTTLYLTGAGDEAFWQMNALWNTVNLTLAAAGLLQAARGEVPVTLPAEITAQHRLEKILLVNAGLDVGYMAAGLLLTQIEQGRFAASHPGWGRALVVQGAFLLVFDVVMAVAHSRNRTYERALQ